MFKQFSSVQGFLTKILRASHTRPMHAVCPALPALFEQLKKPCFFYSSGTGFESLSADQFCLLDVIQSLFRSLKKYIPGFYMKLRCDHFLQHHLQFVTH